MRPNKCGDYQQKDETVLVEAEGEHRGMEEAEGSKQLEREQKVKVW